MSYGSFHEGYLMAITSLRCCVRGHGGAHRCGSSNPAALHPLQTVGEVVLLVFGNRWAFSSRYEVVSGGGGTLFEDRNPEGHLLCQMSYKPEGLIGLEPITQ